MLRLGEAADGFLARVRLPGGLVFSGQLRALAQLAVKLGDGRAELTSRGNVQLRGLAAGAAGPLTDALTAAGLLPSLAHDRVRNVLASPLAGLDSWPVMTAADLTGIVRGLDAALCARPRLAELPGRFLFAIDDGRGDVAGLGADVVAIAGREGAVVNGLAVRRGDIGGVGTQERVAAAMIACAEAFLDLRAEFGSTAWRIADLPGGGDRVRASVSARLGLDAVREGPAIAKAVRPVGLVARQGAADGAGAPASARSDLELSAVLLAPLGRLTSAQLTWLADRATGGPARITPWRSVVLPNLPDAAEVLREAAGIGFGTDGSSPWLCVTACAGRPGCASALADVQADAATFATRWPGRFVHVSGCARHCGRPGATEIDVTATSEGYQVAGD